jgi:pilus assembly protein Flp/PilA
MKKLMAFLKDEDGLETVEYAIILGLIVAGTVTLITALGGWVNGQFTAVNTDLGVPAAP